MKIYFRQQEKTSLPIEEELESLSLTESIEKTRYALEIAYSGFDNALEPALIDSYIFEINSLLKRYEYLNAQALLEKETIPELHSNSPIRALVSHVFG